MVGSDGTKQRAGRSAISLQHILHKRKRYDPKVAKQAQFYASAKQHKSYQRLLKREGYTTPAAQPQTYAHDDDEESDGEAERQQPAKRRREEERAVDEQAADAVEAEATADKRGDSPSHVNDDEGNEGEEREAGWTGPAVKRKKKAAGPVRKSDEQIRAEIAERAQKLRESRHVRAEKFKKHAQRTSKGQPIMAHRMEDLLDKLKRQKQQASGQAPTTSSSSSAAPQQRSAGLRNHAVPSTKRVS